MSSVVRPSGPLPPRVYWLRRTVVLALVVGLVLLGLALRGVNDEPATAGGTPGSPEPSSFVSGRDQALTERDHGRNKGKRSDDSRPDRKRKAKRLAEPDGPCRPEQVRLRPLVSAGNRAGNPVEIRLRMRTTGRAACTVEVDPDELLVKVTSGTDLIWTSDQCPAALWPSQLVVRRSEPLTYRVAWSGRRSARRCPLHTERARPGTYVAAAALIGGEPAETTFMLSPQPAPKAGSRFGPGGKQRDAKAANGSAGP